MLPKVLVVHNRYRSDSPSGENQVVDAQVALLRGAGLDVETYIRSSDEIATFSRAQRVELAVRPIFSREDTAGIDTVIERFRPDVVHLHNVYPLISPAVITRAKSHGCRVVQTVHNFRHVCASGTFFRDGSPCTSCLGKRLPWPAVEHGCYRGSRAQSVALGAAIVRHRGTWSRLDRFLPVSRFVADLLVTSGIPEDQIRVVPNHIPDPGPPAKLGQGFLFAGRLSHEKGVGILLEAWERSELGSLTQLTIAGDGPLRSNVEHEANRLRGVTYTGPVPAEQVRQLMRQSRAVVVPSIWYEALPTVLLESFACGRAVVATKFGALETLVSPDLGWLAAPDPEGLAAALLASQHDPAVATKGACRARPTLRATRPIPRSPRYCRGVRRRRPGLRAPDPGAREQGQPLSSLRRQGSWAVVDQVLSSGTNFVPSLLMARVLGPRGYGTFSLAFLAWFGVLTLVRSALMQPYTLAASANEGDAWRDITRSASGAVILAGVAWGAVFAIVAIVAGPSSALGRSFLVIALLAPGLALQEFWRVASFSAFRARTAAMNDGYWAIGQVVAFGILLSLGHATAPECLLAWGAGAWVAAVLGILQLSVVPRVDLAAVRWARKWGRVGAWFTVASGSYAVSMYGIAVIVSAEFERAAVGLFRIVQLLFGPVQLLTIAGESVFMPHLVRVVKRTGDSGLGLVVRYSLVMGGLVAAYGIALVAAAHLVLVTFFGAAFAGAGALVLPMVISNAIDASCSGADAHLRVREMGSRIAAIQVASSVVRVAAVVVLAHTNGLRGAVWGLVVGSAVNAIGVLDPGGADELARNRTNRTAARHRACECDSDLIRIMHLPYAPEPRHRAATSIEEPSVALLTNAPAPYRTPFFNQLARRCRLLVIFDTMREPGREWEVDEQGFEFEWLVSRSLSLSRSLKDRKRAERPVIHIPFNLMSTLDRFGPDAVVSLEFGARTASAALFCALRRRPLIAWWEGTPHTEAGASAPRVMLRKTLLRHASRAWANGGESARSLNAYGFPDARIDLGMTGTDTARWSHDVDTACDTRRAEVRARLGLRGVVLLFVGSLSSRKGLQHLLDAMTALAQDPTLPEWSALFVGSGPLSDTVAHWSQLHTSVPVALPGFVQPSELADFFAASDVFVMPSVEDVWGMVCLEALVAGLPQVTSSLAGAASSLVTSPEIGSVVNPRDTTEFAGHLALRIRMGAQRVPAALRARAATEWSPAAMTERAMSSIRASIGSGR